MTAKSNELGLVVQEPGTERQDDSDASLEVQGDIVKVPSARRSSRPAQYESIGHASFQAAMRARSLDESRVQLARALAKYEQARALYGQENDPEDDARKTRCTAKIAQVNYWLSSRVSMKRRLINESWKRAKESLRGFGRISNGLEYGRTYNLLSTVPFLAASLAPRFLDGEKILKEAVETGERAVEYLEETGDFPELVTANVKTASYLSWLSEYVRDSSEKEFCLEKARDCWRRAKRFSNNLIVARGIGPEGYALYRVMSPEETLRLTKNALKHARETGDRLELGTSLECLVCLEWDEHFFNTEDNDDRLKLSKQALEHSEEARDEYRTIGFVSPLCFRESLWSEAPHAEYYRVLGQDVEATLKKRRELLLKAAEQGPAMLRSARGSGYKRAVQSAHRVYSRTLLGLATIEHDPDGKKALLKSSLREMEDCVRLSGEINPSNYFSNAADLAELSEVNFQMAELAGDSDRRTLLLRTAVSQQEACVRLGKKDAQRHEKLGWNYFINNLGLWQHKHASLLGKLAEITQDRKDVQSIIQAAEEAAETFRKLGKPNRAAECWWMVAEAQADLDDHSSASKSFLAASSVYESASEKAPQLQEYFRHYASYMKSWSEVEEAQNSHELREYRSASQHYEKAAVLLQNTKWRHIVPSHRALSKIELGEDLSLKGLNKESALAFKEAENLIANLVENPEHAPDPSPGREATRNSALLSRLKRKYCIARIFLEEAKVLDKSAEYSASASKCELASEILSELAGSSELSKEERREMRLAANLANAWGTMARADGSSSTRLFLEASRQFERAARDSPSMATGLLAHGHGLLCKALSAVTRFAAKGNMQLRSDAVQYLEGAASYYLKAGLESYSENTEAVKLVLDGIMYGGLAAKETDEKKRASLCITAEKILAKAAELFENIGCKGKKQEVLRLMDRISRQRDWALSLSDTVTIPSVTSIAVPLNLVASFREQPNGVERYDHADLHASLEVRPVYSTAGQNFELTLTIANTGKGKARLLRLEGIMPEGCELVENMAEYPLRAGRLDLMGKRLDSIETEQIRLVLRPRVQGVFKVETSITYLDESGSRRSYPVDPVDLVGSPVVDFLVRSFVEDHSGRKLALDHSGWRSLMDIVHTLKIPRSQVYGDSSRGHFLAPQVERLVKTGLVESQIFPKGRGRGGLITKLRLRHISETGRKLADQLQLALDETKVPTPSQQVSSL